MAAPRREYPRAPGVALIVCMDFAGTRNPISGAAMDFQHLKDMFDAMKFRTFPDTKKLYWSIEDFKEHLKYAMLAFDEKDFKDGPFFLCFSTHGDKAGIQFSDEQRLSHENLRDILAEELNLRGKAKVIVLQACRGEMCMEKEGVQRSKFNAAAIVEEDPHKDTYVFASCLPSRVSYFCESGSIFIIELCFEVIRQLHETKYCNMVDVKNNVVAAMGNLSRITNEDRNISETVYTTPEALSDSLTAALFLDLRDRAAAPKLFERIKTTRDNLRQAISLESHRDEEQQYEPMDIGQEKAPASAARKLFNEIRRTAENLRLAFTTETVPKGQPAPALAPVPELDLDDLSETDPDERREEKAALLATIRQRGVRRMTNVHCDDDPAWALDVLRSAAPTLEELKVLFLSEGHLLAVHAMPGLRRMELGCGDLALEAQPPVLPALPRGSLQWLRVYGFPRPTVQSLLRAHSATLDVLWLRVGTPGGGEWPEGCDDLDALLGQCGLRVSRLVLWRGWCTHCPSACPAQLAAVRRVLPDANVQCSECDGVAFEAF